MQQSACMGTRDLKPRQPPKKKKKLDSPRDMQHKHVLNSKEDIQRATSDNNHHSSVIGLYRMP